MHKPPPWRGECVIILGPRIQENLTGCYLNRTLLPAGYQPGCTLTGQDDRYDHSIGGNTQRGCMEARGNAVLLLPDK